MKRIKIAGYVVIVLFALIGAYFIVFDYMPMQRAWLQQGCRAYGAAAGVPAQPPPPPTWCSAGGGNEASQNRRLDVGYLPCLGRRLFRFFRCHPGGDQSRMDLGLVAREKISRATCAAGRMLQANIAYFSFRRGSSLEMH
jgi:hypothetical protein